MAEELAKYPGALDFPLLSDSEHGVASQYGIVNPLETEKHGIPYPTVYLINKEGKIAYRFLDEQGHRPSNEQVREQLKAVGMAN